MTVVELPTLSHCEVLSFAGRFALNLQRRELSIDGTRVAIGGRAFDLLHALAQNSGRELTKAELLSLAWPNLTVGENNLHVQISALRKALGHDLIATIPGRGYQFKVGVSYDASTESPTQPEGPFTRLPKSRSTARALTLRSN